MPPFKYPESVHMFDSFHKPYFYKQRGVMLQNWDGGGTEVTLCSVENHPSYIFVFRTLIFMPGTWKYYLIYSPNNPVEMVCILVLVLVK